MQYKNVYSSSRLKKSVDVLESTLIEDLRRHLPHWTPTGGDRIVYSTADLHIGEEGYPQKIMLTGDQQTYKLTKDLQKIRLFL